MKFLDPQKGLGKVFCSIEPMTMLLGGSALASAGGNIFSSIFGSSGASKQANAIKEAAEINRRTALEIDDRQRADMAPFRSLGVDAGSLIGKIINGDMNLDEVLGTSSIFQWQQQEGERAIDRQLAARGQYNSGVGLETLARFNNQLVAEEGQRYWDRLFKTTELGANAAARTASNTTALGGSLIDSQARMGMASAGSLGDSMRSLAALGPGLADPFAGGIKSFMEYNLLKPVFDQYGKGSVRSPNDGGNYAFQRGSLADIQDPYRDVG